VAIAATNIATGVVNRAIADRSGVYSLPLLAAGVYNLTAQMKGFRRYERTQIVVNLGETTRVDSALTGKLRCRGKRLPQGVGFRP